MPKIVINNKSCSIQDENDVDFLRSLYDELSFDVQGAQYTQAYRGYFDKKGEFVRWDGKKHLLSESLKFDYGLLGRVKDFFILNNKEFVIEDNRDLKSQSNKIDILDKLKKINKTPFPYQLEAIEAVKKNDCGILRMATGAGKTLVAALITAEFGKSTIIYVIGTDLLYQIHSLFSSIFDEPIGIVGDGKCNIQNINVATVWSIASAIGITDKKAEDQSDEKKLSSENYSKIKDLIHSAKVHIFDECHLAACESIQAIHRLINPEHIYGMSASPWRDDNADMLIECILGKNIVDISASKLIDNGYLVQPVIKFIPVPPLEEHVTKQYQTIYKKYIVENDIRNDLVVKAAEKLVEQNYQTLVLFKKVDHGKILFDKISKIMPCIMLSGKDDIKTREKAKAELESGRVNCIIASQIFDIGVDLPSLSGLVIASSGKSSVRALQRIGRVIRRHPSKKQAAIIDFVDQAEFLLGHSKARRKIYESEERFKVIWPTKKKK